MLRKFIAIVFILILCQAEQASAAATYGISYGYVPGYSSSTGSYTMSVADIPWSDLSHVAFFVALVSGTSVALSDPLALHSTLVNQAHARGVRCYMTVGGANGNTWPTTSANCQTLADNIVSLATSDGFDGVDIDCEFPGDSGYPATAAFDALMNEVRSKANSATPGLAKSGNYARESNFGVVMYLSPGYDICGYDFTTLNNDVDWYTFSGYDLNIGFAGSYQGPLVDTVDTFTNCAGSAMDRSLSATSNWYNTVGSSGTIPYNQMVLGMPMYGRDSVTPSNASKSDNDVFLNGSAGTYNTGYAECPYTESGETYGMDTSQSYCDKINWAVGSKGMIGVALFDMGQGLQSGGPSNTQLVNIWSAVAGTNGCVTVGTNPCAPGTCSPTPTATGTPACGTLIDNFESGVDQDALKGYWSTYAPTGTTINGAATIPTANDGLNGSVYGGRLTGTTSAANSPSASCGLGLSGATYSVGSTGQTGLVFTVRVDNGPGGTTPMATNINVSIQTVNSSGAVYATNVPIPASYVGNGTFKSGTPYHVTLLFSNMPYSYGGTSGPMNTASLYLLSFRPDVYSTNSGDFDFTLDDIYFSCPPTPTPTPTFSQTPTNTQTSTQTHTPTVPPTNTQTQTNTGTSSATSTPSQTPTNTVASTSTFTMTNTATVALTNTQTSTQTASNTATPQPPTSTHTFTQTETVTESVTNTATGVLNTATATNSETSTSTPASTDTQTQTDTVTNTPNGPTNTQTSTSTVTNSVTNSPTVTGTYTNTPNGPTNTQTNTGTQTSTSTVTETQTQTNTTTPIPPTNTQTNTGTVTASGTMTNTVTVTESQTNTPTSTNTSTTTPRSTATASSTQTNTSTITATGTYTPSTTPTIINVVEVSAPFPNPATERVQVYVTAGSASSIEMEVFTTAFRKVVKHTFQSGPIVSGAPNSSDPIGTLGSTTAIQWDLTDTSGVKVADGLYYMRIRVNGSQTKILKILVLR